MAKIKKAQITETELLADGWIKSKEKPAIVLFEKAIENRNPINNTPEDTDIKLILHGFYNCWTFAVLLPNGAMLNFVANSMKELQDFENRLNFYDCEY
jgi:hypothetical protein